MSPDQSTEWLNAVGKTSGGLVGITRVPSALNCWTLSYNLRTMIASQTMTMLHLDNDEDEIYTHNESTKSRRVKDDQNETKLVTTTKQHGMFASKLSTLQDVVNKDLATPSIQESLLNAEHLGTKQMTEFVERRICTAPGADDYQIAHFQKQATHF